jgi:mannose-1-phosphate guanylyltransferase
MGWTGKGLCQFAAGVMILAAIAVAEPAFVQQQPLSPAALAVEPPVELGFDLDDFWTVGVHNGSWQATQMILRGEFKIDMPGRELAPGIWGGINLAVDLAKTDIRPPVYLGSCTAIEPGATVIGPTVIGRTCIIQAGARIDACVVDDYTRVSGFAGIHDKIVSGRFCVDRNGRNVDLAGTGYGFVVDMALTF